MSVKAMSYVWDNYKEGGSKKLVLLAIADISDNEGICYPGVKRIAEMACLSERYTQKIIRELQASGDLRVEIGEGLSTIHGMTNRYYMVKFRNHYRLDTGEQGDTPSGNGVNNRTPDGVNRETPHGVNNRTPKPSVEPSVKAVVQETTPLVVLDDKPIVEQDTEIGQVFRGYEHWIGIITPGIADELKVSTVEYGAKWIAEAMEEAAKNNVRRWKYVDSILKRWKLEGRSNAESVTQAQEIQGAMEQSIQKSVNETGLMYDELLGGGYGHSEQPAA